MEQIFKNALDSIGPVSPMPLPQEIQMSECSPAILDLVETSRLIPAQIQRTEFHHHMPCNYYEIKNPPLKVYSFGRPLNEHLWRFINKIIALLSKLFGQRQKHQGPLQIALGYSPLKKLLPRKKRILEPIHVNSGVSIPTSSACVVYRREEMCKVILHELLHIWNFDGRRDEAMDRRIEARYKINSLHQTIRLGEAYNDAMCCIIISAIRARACAGADADASYHFQIDKTRRHIFEKAGNVQRFYGSGAWTESTHAFSYYVAKAVIFQHLPLFEAWLLSQPHHGANADFYAFLVPLLEAASPPPNFAKYASASRSLRMLQKRECI